MDFLINNYHLILGIPVATVGVSYILYNKVSRYQSDSEMARQLIREIKANITMQSASEDGLLKVAKAIGQHLGNEPIINEANRAILNNYNLYSNTGSKLDKLQYIISMQEWNHTWAMTTISIGMIVLAVVAAKESY